MKGQRLFIRPIEAADAASIRAFLDRNGDASAVPACGLLGKLVGDLVAVLAMQITPDAVEIEDILVSRDLRRKHIGRAMIDEAEQIAARIERAQLVVSPDRSAGATPSGVSGKGTPAVAGFLRRVGFDREGERWIRQVRVGRTERH